MRKRQESDASFLIGIVLGVFVGSAIALILAPQSGEESRAALSEKVGEARQSLAGGTREAQERIEGAAEGAE